MLVKRSKQNEARGATLAAMDEWAGANRRTPYTQNKIQSHTTNITRRMLKYNIPMKKT